LPPCLQELDRCGARRIPQFARTGCANRNGRSGHWSGVAACLSWPHRSTPAAQSVYLTQGLQRSLQRHPHKTALLHLGEGVQREHRFDALVDQVARQAAALAACGIGTGDRVALLAPNTDQLVLALLACWWRGAVACPLNTRWSEAEIAHALEDSGAALLLVDEAFAAWAADA